MENENAPKGEKFFTSADFTPSHLETLAAAGFGSVDELVNFASKIKMGDYTPNDKYNELQQTNHGLLKDIANLKEALKTSEDTFEQRLNDRFNESTSIKDVHSFLFGSVPSGNNPKDLYANFFDTLAKDERFKLISEMNFKSNLDDMAKIKKLASNFNLNANSMLDKQKSVMGNTIDALLDEHLS